MPKNNDDIDIPKTLGIIQRKMEIGLGEVRNSITIASNQNTFKLLTLETKFEVFGEIIMEMAHIITQKSEAQLQAEFKNKWAKAYNRNLKAYDKMLRTSNPFAGIKITDDPNEDLHG